MSRTALIAAGVAALVGALLFGLYIRQFEAEATGGARVRVLMVKRDIAMGEPLTHEVLGVREVPQAYFETRHIPEKNIEQVLGVNVSTAVKANQSLLWTDLAMSRQLDGAFAEMVRNGMRAMAINARNVDFNGLLRAGDRVDVLLTKERPGGGERVTIPLLQNVLVYAVGNDAGIGAKHHKRGKGGVVLGVTLAQAGLLAHAQEGGTLHLLLRNPDDIEVLASAAETVDADVMKARERQRMKTNVAKAPRQEPGIIRIQ